jgi:hypothetical protein
MEKYVDSLLTEINQFIRNLEKTETNYIIFSKEAFEFCEQKKMQLKQFLVTYNFNTENEEIVFFKLLKPKIEIQSIFYSSIFKIESKMLKMSKENQIAYYNKHITKILRFFKSKRNYYNYYKTNNTLLDSYYFLRKNNTIQSYTKFASVDFSFSTGFDFTFNKIAANEELIIYLEKRISDLTGDPAPKIEYQNYNIKWTANKVDLIELMYALFAAKAVNDGNIDLSKLADAFQRFFNIEFGDFYRTYSEMKLRNNKVKFLEKITISLENKMENDY